MMRGQLGQGPSQVMTIGIMGYALDSVCVYLIKRFSWQRGAQ